MNDETNGPDETDEANVQMVGAFRVEGGTTLGCACGCGLAPKSARSSFLQGHDARLLGQVKRGEKGRETLVSFPILLAKLDNSGSRTTKPRTPRAPKADQAADSARTVKVGRWEYPVVASASAGNGELAVTYRNRQDAEITIIVPKSAVK